MSEDNNRQEYPEFSGEAYDISGYLGDVLKYHIESSGLKGEKFAEQEFFGMKMHKCLGLPAAKSLSGIITNLKKGIFCKGRKPYDRMAILYAFFGLEEESLAVKLLKQQAGNGLVIRQWTTRPAGSRA